VALDHAGKIAFERAAERGTRICWAALVNFGSSGGEEIMRPEKVVHSDPEILGGTPVFVGTRVPVRTLIDHLEAGDTIEQFLHSFPSVSRDQAVAALEMAGDFLADTAHSRR